MSVCAVVLCKDEADIIGHTLAWLATQVDEIVVMDNMSSDGTYEIAVASGAHVIVDDEVGYYQSRKTTELARLAYAAGHEWVLPCDADEIWHTADIVTPIRDWVKGITDCQIVEAKLFHHWPTDWDPETDVNPLTRIAWRSRESGAMPKVMCRTARDLVIGAGNHDASYDGHVTRAGGLSIRHFSWRSPEQYLRKIRNGEAAYAATDLDPSVGQHWRSWAGKPDEAILDWYERWALHRLPAEDESLIYDPSPRAT